MSLEQHTIIEAFLNGEMGVSERADFETAMSADEKLKDAVEMYRLANQLIYEGALLDIRGQLEDIHRSASRRKPGSYLYWFLLLAVCGTVATVILIDETTGDTTESGYLRDTNSAPSDVVLSDTTLSDTSEQHTVIQTYSEKIKENNPIAKDQQEAESLYIDPHTIRKPYIPLSEVNRRIMPYLFKNTEVSGSEGTTDPCDGYAKKILYKLESPCPDGTGGSIEFTSNGNHPYDSYSLDNGKSYHPMNRIDNLPPGTYTLIGRSGACTSDPEQIDVRYGSCNYVIYPGNNAYMDIKLDLPDVQMVTFVVRNARTGVILYREVLQADNPFTWKGQDNQGNMLPFGNYVYTFTGTDGTIVSTGQVTIVN